MPFDVEHALEKALKCQPLDVLSTKVLCERLKLVLIRECNVKSVPAPVTIVGDVHGQVFDLLELFRIGGPVPHTNYLFLGDYVDRGPFSVETITLLALLKLSHPERVTLLRGNHESRQITQVYGFYAECLRKFGGPAVWQYFTELFDYLPIAALVGGSLLAVHGGLSPSIHHLDQIRILDRFAEIPHDGPLADLMWSDPDPDKTGFVISPRGAGYVFGHDVVWKFLHMNGLAHIVRAHQLCMTGYQVLFEDSLSTVWSAPNYCYRFGNTASILEVSEDLGRFFNVFGAAPESERQRPSNEAAPASGGSGSSHAASGSSEKAEKSAGGGDSGASNSSGQSGSNGVKAAAAAPSSALLSPASSASTAAGTISMSGVGSAISSTEGDSQHDAQSAEAPRAADDLREATTSADRKDDRYFT